MKNNNPPIFEVIEEESVDRGLYRLTEHRYVLDGNGNILPGDVVGLKFKGSHPIFLRSDAITMKKIGDKFYPVFIKEVYVKEKNE